MQQALLDIDIDALMPDPAQPRKSFLKTEIERLAASVKARGVLQPLRVQRDEERQCWRIVIGECRWRAARLAGLATVPCLEVDGEPDEVEVLADQVIENTVRNSLRPLELARSLAKLKALKACNSQALAREFGLSGSAITRAEALLTLTPDVQDMVDDGRVPESAAYEISRLADPEAQRGLAMLVAGKKLNREQVQEAVRGAVGKRNVAPRGGRLSCRLDGGVSVTIVGAGQSLTKADLTAAIERLRKEMKKLEEAGDTADLARAS
jgi:ParB family transcriptional regulator, chromosome partitioning protein